MDTNEQEPTGGQDVSSSQDTSTDIAQPTETEEVVDGDQSEEVGEQALLLAGKYKSPEELEKAYKELEGKFGEVGQKAEIANLLEKHTGMNPQQIKDYLANQERQRMDQAIRENPGLAAFQEVQQLKGQIAYQAEEKELDNFLSSEEGKPYADFKQEIMEDAFNIPRFKDKSFMEIAQMKYGRMRAQGQQDAYNKIETKRNTQATGASQQAPKSRLTPEDMQNMTSAEMEQVLPWADISHRL